MAELTTAWMLGFVCGFFMGVTVARALETLRRFRRSPAIPLRVGYGIRPVACY